MPIRHSVTDRSGVRAMQRLCQRIWDDKASWHIGDMAWGRNQHVGREPEWPTAYWEHDGEVVAWVWVRLPGHLDLAVDPAYSDLIPEILDWFESVAETSDLSAYALATEAHLTDAFEAAGFRVVDDDPNKLRRYVHDLVDIDAPVVPDGFTLRRMRGPEDIEQRVAVHRSGFAPSRVTVESFANVMAAWPYDVALDWLVEAPDGRFAASCLIWYDEANRCGEIEPVATHQDFRRRGLARAACLGALRAVRDIGAATAVVATYDVPGKPGPAALYRGLGFVGVTATVKYAKTI